MHTRYPFLALLFALALVLTAAAQTTPPSDAPAPPPAGSQYFVAGGVGLYRASVQLTSGWASFGLCLGTGTCPYLELQNVTAVTSTMQGGVMQRLKSSGNLTLYAILQGGGANTAGNLAAVFSGGVVLAYSRPTWHGISIAFPVKIIKIMGPDPTAPPDTPYPVHLAYGLGVSKAF